jgi:hypothetical protein
MEDPSRAPLLVRLAMTLLLATSQLTMAYNLDPDSQGRMISAQTFSTLGQSLIGTYTESIMSISKQMAEDLVAFYNGSEPGGTPGLLPDPYYCTYLLSHSVFPVLLRTKSLTNANRVGGRCYDGYSDRLLVLYGR